MKKVYYNTLLCIMSLGILCGCSKDNGDEPVPNPVGDIAWYGVQKGTIDYGADGKMIFDDYGKKERFEQGSTVYIYTLEKLIVLNTENQTYTQRPTIEGERVIALHIFLGADVWTGATLVGAQKSTQTIAGKPCIVWTWNDQGVTYKYGGWNRILFIGGDDEEGVQMLAKSFSETIPANAFEIPVGYRLEN